MSRNKENNPLPSQTRVNGSVFATSKSTPSSEFFTDSILEDTSRIPSPSPLKAALSNPRRALPVSRALQVSRDSANTAYRSSTSINGNKTSTRHQQPAPILGRPSHRSSQQDLITPPQSRDGPDLKSPTSDVSSPPRGLTDVYQRIHDEEELAEREVEDDEDEEEMVLQQDDQSPSKPRKSSSQRSLASKSSTPVGMPVDANKENMLDEQTGSLSEASGLSFLQGLTDPRIAAVLTPHMTERAKDLRRLQNISARPIVFHQGPKPSELAEDTRSSASSDRGSNSGRAPRPRSVATERANGVSRAQSDTVMEPQSQTNVSKTGRVAPKSKDAESFEDEDTSDELKAAEREVRNRKLKRLLSYPLQVPQTITQPGSRKLSAIDTSGKNGLLPDAGRGKAEDEVVDDKNNNTQKSVQSDSSYPLDSQTNSIPNKNPVPATAKGMLSLWARKAAEQRTRRWSDSSQIDWAGVGADVPLPSVESSTPQVASPRPDTADSLRSQKSTDRLRRLDNDFTGMSFQVSESPPVRSRKSVEDYLLDKEMAVLNKKALTTNQLNAIREKDPREAHRRLSRSPSAGQLKTKQSIESLDAVRQPESAGQQVPDTPVVIYRSSTTSSKEVERPSQQPKHDRQTSHDHLQRLARAMSNTPRSSPAPIPSKDELLDDESISDAGGEAAQDTFASSANAPELQHDQPKKPLITETPKVIGAWTDTVLPDTIKTVKQTARQPSRYAQTPHVSAGGWIDTPLPTGHRQSSALAPMTVEEVTKEVTAPAISKPQLNTNNHRAPIHQTTSPVEVGNKSPPASHTRHPPRSILSRVLEDDTFDFGDATLDSLGGLLDDTTKMLDDRKSSLQQQQKQEQEHVDTLIATDELGFIDHLGGKLREVAVGLHDTRKGISNLERAFMRASSPNSDDSAEQQKNHQHNSVVPVVYSTITLPLPLLFHPPARKPNGQRQWRHPFGHPTLLGYITIALWAWYLLECLASELFSHPLYAERYEWPAVDAPEPVFPFVLPTLLLGCFGINVNLGAGGSEVFWTFFTPLYVFLRAVWRILAMAMGWSDGFVDGAVVAGVGGAMRNATSVVAQAAKAVVTEGLAGEEWNVMNDDFI